MLKPCQKCGGKQIVESDRVGLVLTCMNCGRCQYDFVGTPRKPTTHAGRELDDQPLDFYPDPEDDGCEESISCKACPLPTCKYDIPQNIRRKNQTLQKGEEITVLLHQKLSHVAIPIEALKEIATEKGITLRTVYRQLARVKAHESSLQE